MTTQSDRRRQQHEQRARQLDRWLDVLAAQYGLPRIVMLRQFRHAIHVGQALARLMAAQQEQEQPPVGEQRYGYVSLADDAPHTPRDQQSEPERTRRDAETNDILADLKRQQEAGQE